MNNVTVGFVNDFNEVWIVPRERLTIQNFMFILEFLENLGYKYWLPGSEGLAYRFAKEINQ